MIHIQRISVKVMLPLQNVIQRQLALMKSKVYDFAMWVGGIPLGFPSILTHNIMIDSRYLKWSPHIVLMDMLFELLHDLQFQGAIGYSWLDGLLRNPWSGVQTPQVLGYSGLRVAEPLVRGSNP